MKSCIYIVPEFVRFMFVRSLFTPRPSLSTPTLTSFSLDQTRRTSALSTLSLGTTRPLLIRDRERERKGVTMPHSTTSPPSSPPAVATASRSEIVIRHDGALPYWLVNVPQSEWPVQCPDFLLNQSQKNVRCLSMPDEKYTKQTWDVVKDIIS